MRLFLPSSAVVSCLVFVFIQQIKSRPLSVTDFVFCIWKYLHILAARILKVTHRRSLMTRSEHRKALCCVLLTWEVGRVSVEMKRFVQ